MVILSAIRLYQRKARRYFQEGFRDSLRVVVAGGKGGNGYPKFGGVGGNGGDVKVIAKEDVTLNDVYKSNRTKRYIGKSGRHSTHNFILGPPGDGVTFEVPVGVTVYTELGKKLGELNEEGEEIILARGGTGGNPKNGFLGTKGQEYPVILDLKLIADFGLVGFPNAGKSTLLKAISHANPKIANYPFTTIRPNVGQLVYKDFRKISMADLPGLIEGAYANKGMGHKFLKHVERTKIMLFIVDVNGFQLSPQYPHRSCFENILLLNRELELYNEDLVDKPLMIVINKMDTEGAQKKYDEVKDQLKNLPEILSDYPEDMRPEKLVTPLDIKAISAKTNSNDVKNLKERLRVMLDVQDDLRKKEEEAANADLYSNMRETLTQKGPRLV